MNKATPRKRSQPPANPGNSAGKPVWTRADETPAAQQPCRPARWWIKVFVPLHILAITIYALPELPAAVMQGKIQPRGTDWLLYVNEKYARTFPPVQAYVFGTGFWQYWDMFAPDPVQVDQYCTAKIVYKDGQIRDYQYPRMFSLSIPQKFLQERYRKFYERAHDYFGDPNAAHGFVAQRFAQRIALINDNSPSNPPVEVHLYIHQWNVPPPGKSLVPKYLTAEYFDYIVDQKLLDKAKDGSS